MQIVVSERKLTLRHLIWTQSLEWESLTLDGAKGRSWIKTLSMDTSTGARTVLLRFEPGWTKERGKSRIAWDLFVLDGEMKSGERVLKKNAYWYRPPGQNYERLSSVQETKVLAFLGSPWQEGDSREEVFVRDVKEVAWDSPRNQGKPKQGRFRAKVLRADPGTGFTIKYAEYLPDEYRGTFVHPEYEESYCLAGEMSHYEEDVAGHVSYRRGSYVSRPPGSRHGDYTVRSRCVLVLRVHGKQATRLSIRKRPPARMEF